MTTINKLKPLVLSALIASCLTMGWQKESEAAQLTVDEFSNPGTANAACGALGFEQCTYYSSFAVTPPNYLNDQQLITGMQIIGTTRELSITDLTGSGSTAVHGVLPLGGPGGNPAGIYQFFDLGIPTTFDATLLYNSGGGGLNTNASAYNNGQFIIDVSGYSEANPGIFTATVTLNGSDIGEGPKTLNANGLLTFDLSTFSSVNLTSLNSIQVNLSPDATWDGSFQINRIYLEAISGEIPEPTSILSIVGVGVLAFASRRQKKN